MKYFLDTEFLEGTQKKWFGQTKPTIDLISIGIVCEDGREYYAISKDFNLKEAWNRYDIKSMSGKGGIGEDTHDKIYWIRENILKPIFIELRAKEVEEYNIAKRINVVLDFPTYHFTYKSIKRLINKYGKSNQQIAEEVYEFCSNDYHKGNNLTFNQRKEYSLYDKFKPEFYGYYSDYDWVVLCWLFGKMIDLPKGFPMHCNDLKQILDERAKRWLGNIPQQSCAFCDDFDSKLDSIKSCKDYPKQTNEHNVLADAKWNFELYKFLNNI